MSKKGPPKGTSRRYRFTEFPDEKGNYVKTIDQMFLDDRVNWIGWGNEICPETKKPHRQAWIELVDPMRYTAVQDIVGKKVNCDKERNKEGHTNYCMGILPDGSKKPGWQSYETRGPKKEKKQGARTDLDKFYKDIKEGKSEKEVLENNVEAYVKYTRAYDRIKKLYDRKPAWRKVEVHILWGKAGTGKSHYPACIHGEENVYRLTGAMAQSGFWRDYNGEEVLVLDEFTGAWMKYEEFNQILDGYPYNVNIKGSSMWAKYTKVYITSNLRPQKWYPGVFAKSYETWQALKRRVLSCEEVTSPRYCEHFKRRFDLSQKWLVILG